MHDKLSQFLKKAAALERTVRRFRRRFFPKRFSGSAKYWERRYAQGRHSGAGSYGQFAQFKAEIINRFVVEQGITSVIEYGCGDGNQLGLLTLPDYIGFDVSPTALARCKDTFAGDLHKRFKLMREYRGERAELTLSLDVIFHLVEDQAFNIYMQRLFDSAGRFVLIYSSNTDENTPTQAQHVKHHRFTDWIEHHKPNWQLILHIPNRHPFTGDVNTGSRSAFYIYARSVP